jgi:hypothetical protein
MQGCQEAGIPAFGTLWDFVGVAFATCWLLEADDICQVNIIAITFLSFWTYIRPLHSLDSVEHAQLPHGEVTRARACLPLACGGVVLSFSIFPLFHQ